MLLRRLINCVVTVIETDPNQRGSILECDCELNAATDERKDTRGRQQSSDVPPAVTGVWSRFSALQLACCETRAGLIYIINCTAPAREHTPLFTLK